MTIERTTDPRARAAVFDEIYRNNRWGDDESTSGPGSTDTRTAAFRFELPVLFDAFAIRTLLDAPCGDFNWMRHVPVGRYIGVDIVSELVERNARLYGRADRDFLRLDFVVDPLPRADAILCRDAFVHLSFAEIDAALRNFARSGATYLLATTFPKLGANDDIETGGWRPLNLERAPFVFPAPLQVIDEHRLGPDGTDVGKMLALWPLSQIAS